MLKDLRWRNKFLTVKNENSKKKQKREKEYEDESQRLDRGEKKTQKLYVFLVHASKGDIIWPLGDVSKGTYLYT